MKLALESSDLLLTFDNVQFIDRCNPKSKSMGSLHLTSSHFVYTDSSTKRDIWIYYSLIQSIDKQPLNINGSPLFIRCKHYLNCLFLVSKERDCQTLYSTLLKYSRPYKYLHLQCFKPNEHLKFLKSTALLSNNEKIFDLESEFARMGLPNNDWSLTNINTNFEICDSYPNVLYVPSMATDSILKSSASFRSRGRLPVLSYLHHNSASICRCAQPLAGLNGRCVEDEQLMQFILQTNHNAKQFMYVVDTRPKINAMANKAQGKGYENEANYANIQFCFIGIENIHVMRSSLQKLIECSDSSTAQFLNNLDKSDWLKHIKAIIDTSKFIMEAVHDQNSSVVVHCSDGWDRTAQTCALASLLLDPYYRTLHGFRVLIEKEFLMFGHKFSDRCGHLYENEQSLKETSPIFTQFLECVWQLTQQFPCAFEFNEIFLIKLHEHVYSCQFGTFIGNCYKDRIELNLKETTYSLWDYIQYKISDYANPLYVPNSIHSREVLRPDTKVQCLKYWRSLYNRFDSVLNPSEKLHEALLTLSNHTLALNEYAKLLEKDCMLLRKFVESKDGSNGEELSVPSLDKLALDYNSLELKWKSARKSCECSRNLLAFDSASAKLNCSSCGDIFCEKCVENGKYLTSQVSTRLKFVCQNCFDRFRFE